MRGRPSHDQTFYIELLKEFYAKYTRAPQRRELPGHATTIRKKFGSWNDALKAADIPILREQNPPTSELIKSLKSYYAVNNKSPRAVDCRKENGLYDTKTYYKFFRVDSWADVLKAAELPIYFECYDPGDRNEVEILIEVSMFIRMNKITSGRMYDIRKIKSQANLPSSFALIAKYGNWRNVRKQAGLSANMNRYSKKMFIERLKDFVSTNSKVPTLMEFAKHLGVPGRSITAHLGPFNDFIISQGYTPRFRTPNRSHKNKKAR